MSTQIYCANGLLEEYLKKKKRIFEGHLIEKHLDNNYPTHGYGVSDSSLAIRHSQILLLDLRYSF